MIRSKISLFLIDKLMDLDPPMDSILGRFFDWLTDWEEIYENKHFPMELKDNELIDDGFGNKFPKCCWRCGRNSMEIVRVGKVQCRFCD